MPFSNRGTALLLGWVDQVSPLEIEYRSGKLIGELQLARIGFSAGSVAMGLEQVSMKLQSGCLWRSRLCLDYLQLESLELVVADPDEN